MGNRVILGIGMILPSEWGTIVNMSSVSTIDQQHKVLISMLKDLNDAVKNGIAKRHLSDHRRDHRIYAITL